MATSKPSPPARLDLKRHWLSRYVFALTAVVAAAVVREGLTRLGGGSLPTYITFYPAVMLSALLGGVGPGLLATVASALGVDYFVLAPHGSFAVASLADAVGLAFFTGTGVFLSVVAELYRRARQQNTAGETEAPERDVPGPPARWTRQRLLLDAGLAVSLTLLAVAGWQSANNLEAQAQADQAITRAHFVIQEFDRLLSALKDEETGQRGYLLTGEDKYLEPYLEACGQVQTNLAGLKQLARANAPHERRLAAIEALVQDKEAELNQTIELRRSQGLPPALAVVKTDKGRILMDQIRGQVAEAQADLENVLQSQLAAKSANAGKTGQALLAGGVLAFLLLITVFLYLKRENFRRTIAEADLRHHRDHLRDMVDARTAELGRSNEHLKKEINEHQQAREALIQSRERLDLALISSRMATFDWDIVKDKRIWSHGVHNLLGTNEETFTGTAEEFFQVMPPEDRKVVQAALARVIERTGVYETEYRAVWPDGSIRHIAARGRIHRDDAGRAVLLTGVCWDITASKQKEEDLIRLNRALKALQESSQAMTRADSETEYLKAVCRNLIANCGYSMAWLGFAEEDEARSVRPVAHAGFDEGYLDTLKITWADSERGRGPTGTAIRTGKPCACRNMLADPAFAPWRADALKRGYACSLVVPLLSEGKAFGAITIYSERADAFPEDEIQLLTQLAEDVSNCVRSLRANSDRQRAERRTELLAEAASRLLTSDEPQRTVDELCGKVLEFLDCQVFFNFLVDEKQQRLHLNACAGIEQREAGNIEWLDHCAALCASAVHDGCRFVAGNIQQSPDPRTGLVKPFGIEAYACHPLRVGGQFLGTLSFGTRARKAFTEDELSLMKAVADLVVTAIERKRAHAALQLSAEEAKRSNRDLEQFAYIASHDLQEPLRAVGGYVKLLERRFPENMDPKALEYINGAAEGAARMERLITDLLAYSRVGTRGGVFSIASLDAILEDALRNLQISIETAQAKITRDPLPALPVDATQMMQLFQNLIGNALKFHGERPPEIHVGARQQPGRWVFTVRDNGIGIEPQYFERIFQIFQRLHTRNRYPGTGIGLAICKRIVERHEGEIWVESQPGQGSTFCFSLPEISAINQHDV